MTLIEPLEPRRALAAAPSTSFFVGVRRPQRRYRGRRLGRRRPSPARRKLVVAAASAPAVDPTTGRPTFTPRPLDPSFGDHGPVRFGNTRPRGSRSIPTAIPLSPANAIFRELHVPRPPEPRRLAVPLVRPRFAAARKKKIRIPGRREGPARRRCSPSFPNGRFCVVRIVSPAAASQGDALFVRLTPDGRPDPTFVARRPPFAFLNYDASPRCALSHTAASVSAVPPTSTPFPQVSPPKGCLRTRPFSPCAPGSGPGWIGSDPAAPSPRRSPAPCRLPDGASLLPAHRGGEDFGMDRSPSDGRPPRRSADLRPRPASPSATASFTRDAYATARPRPTTPDCRAAPDPASAARVPPQQYGRRPLLPVWGGAPPLPGWYWSLGKFDRTSANVSLMHPFDLRPPIPRNAAAIIPDGRVLLAGEARGTSDLLPDTAVALPDPGRPALDPTLQKKRGCRPVRSRLQFPRRPVCRQQNLFPPSCGKVHARLRGSAASRRWRPASDRVGPLPLQRRRLARTDR